MLFRSQEASYNAASILQDLATQADGLKPGCQVVWGGGEPTLSPRFEPINQLLTTLPAIRKVRVLSNSLKFSGQLEALLADPRFHLVTSIDAGTDETFKAIRGKGDIPTVLSNLHRYQARMDDPRRLTIKYILQPGNQGSAELAAFVEQVKQADLMKSLFQIGRAHV